MTETARVKWEYDAAIAASGTESTSINLNSAALVGLYIPAGWDAADITFKMSHDGSTWYPGRDAAGTLLTLTGFSAGDYIALPAGAFHGIENIRFVSTATQTDAVVLKAVLRPFA